MYIIYFARIASLIFTVNANHQATHLSWQDIWEHFQQVIFMFLIDTKDGYLLVKTT